MAALAREEKDAAINSCDGKEMDGYPVKNVINSIDDVVKNPINSISELEKTAPQKPTHPGGNFIGSYIHRSGIRYPVFRGPRGGFFAAGLDGMKKYLTEAERRDLNLEDYNSNIKPSYEHPKGVYTNVNLTLNTGEVRPIFRGSRGGCFYATPTGGMTYLNQAQRELLGLDDDTPDCPSNSSIAVLMKKSTENTMTLSNDTLTGSQTKKADPPSFPGAVFTGKYLDKKGGPFAVFKGPRGGFFYVAAGSKRYLTDSDRSQLGLN